MEAIILTDDETFSINEFTRGDEIFYPEYANELDEMLEAHNGDTLWQMTVLAVICRAEDRNNSFADFWFATTKFLGGGSKLQDFIATWLINFYHPESRTKTSPKSIEWNVLINRILASLKELNKPPVKSSRMWPLLPEP